LYEVLSTPGPDKAREIPQLENDFRIGYHFQKSIEYYHDVLITLSVIGKFAEILVSFGDFIIRLDF